MRSVCDQLLERKEWFDGGVATRQYLPSSSPLLTDLMNCDIGGYVKYDDEENSQAKCELQYRNKKAEILQGFYPLSLGQEVTICFFVAPRRACGDERF